MKALLAFDKFKGSLSASEACAIATEAIQEFDETVEIVSRPLSDGGEGFCEIVTTALGGVFRDYQVSYSDLRTGNAKIGYVFLNKVTSSLRKMLDLPASGLLAIIEMAQAAGHHQVPDRTRNPWHYTTAGVGEMIRYAQIEGASSILLGMGGSATNDMGIGLLEAMGLRAQNSNGRTISPIIPSIWSNIESFEAPTTSQRFDLNVRIACDVRNPLHGDNGAAAVFGPQKGLHADELAAMQASMQQVSGKLLKTPGLRNVDPATEGMGAAGGLPFGLSLLFDAQLIPGFDLICEILDLTQQIQSSDIVFTGEGALDKSSLSGKGPYEVVRRAVAANKRVAVLPGKVFPEVSDHLTALHPKVQVLQVGLPNASIAENIQQEPKHLKQRVKTVMSFVHR